MELTLQQIKQESISFPKGMLHPERTAQFESQICHIVINLTDLKFTDEDIDLLNMGLSFSSSPTKHSVADMWLDYKRF